MSWMMRLYQTYDHAISQGNMIEANLPIPIAHTIQNAHINIVVDGDGNFLDASVLGKEKIVLPATESSQGRASGVAPHPLADKIKYVAGDYTRLGGSKPECFDAYQELLRQWSESEHSHDSVRAVFRYISRKLVVSDLVENEVLWVDDENKLLTLWSYQNRSLPRIFRALSKNNGKYDQGGALVCWTVEASNIQCSDTWKDKSLQECWRNYDERHSNTTALCYVSGKEEPVALNHPARLRNSGDKAKLISSNDVIGFTFRGRFTDTKASVKKNGLQGATVGSISTQKVHNALRWLIDRQGHWARDGDQVVITWATSTEILHPFQPIVEDSLWDEIDEEKLTETDRESVEEIEDDVSDQSRDIGFRYAKKLSAYMNGYKQNIDFDDTVSVMAIDSAVPGRMAVTYYREAMVRDYLHNIKAWHEDFAWCQWKGIDITQNSDQPQKMSIWPILAPAPKLILESVYGDILKSNKKLKKQFYRRMLPSLLDRADVPRDILERALSEASKPIAKKEETWKWERYLGVACSLFRGHYIRHVDKNKRRHYSMALDTTITSRDYLYGRLLALAEHLESRALWIANAERPTTANRLMQRFADRPYSTWLIIYKQLDPYIRQLASSRPKFLEFIRREIDEVSCQFNRTEFIEDTALSGEFLLGFHCQRLALRDTTNNEKDLSDQVKEEQ